tara:strand:+ start:172 stop:564 length:393 start_codon:yes stop_codon:yes gene_type:complete
MRRSKDIIIARYILYNYSLDCDIIFSNINDKACYDFDNNVIKLSDKYKFKNGFDFIMTILHEVKHIIDITRLGYKKYIKKYNQAGVMAERVGKNFHDDNRWEIKAERWALNQMNILWSKWNVIKMYEVFK